MCPCQNGEESKEIQWESDNEKPQKGGGAAHVAKPNYRHYYLISILEVGHPGIWSRDINIWGTVLGIYLHFLRKIRFFNSMSRAY